MIKLKWFQVSFPINFDEISDRFLTLPYSDKRMSGIEMISFNSNTIEAKFIEKIVYEEIIIDPFGNEIITKRVRYNVFNFTLSLVSEDYIVLIIHFPPKSVKSFTNLLYELFGVGFFINTINIKLNNFIEFIKTNLFFKQLKISNIKLSGLSLSQHSTARMEIVSSSDAYIELLNLYPNPTFILEKLKMNFLYLETKGSIEISKSGLIIIDDNFDDNLVNIFNEFISKNH